MFHVWMLFIQTIFSNKLGVLLYLYLSGNKYIYDQKDITLNFAIITILTLRTACHTPHTVLGSRSSAKF